MKLTSSSFWVYNYTLSVKKKEITKISPNFSSDSKSTNIKLCMIYMDQMMRTMMISQMILANAKLINGVFSTWVRILKFIMDMTDIIGLLQSISRGTIMTSFSKVRLENSLKLRSWSCINTERWGLQSETEIWITWLRLGYGTSIYLSTDSNLMSLSM